MTTPDAITSAAWRERSRQGGMHPGEVKRAVRRGMLDVVFEVMVLSDKHAGNTSELQHAIEQLAKELEGA